MRTRVAGFAFVVLLSFAASEAAARHGGHGYDPAAACALYDARGYPAGYDTRCLDELGVEPEQGTYRPWRREGEILTADPYVYYCPVSANNGLGHLTTVFTGSGFVSDVFDMPFDGTPCTPQPPQRVLPGLN
ncbi:MAG: hypothetical protein RH982_13660 [Parvibaculum sp.]